MLRIFNVYYKNILRSGFLFGYVTPLKPELKIREYESFKSYYCGICMHIKESFGNIPRMSLNYDMTFLGLLLDGLHKEERELKIQRCIAHPLKKKPMIINNKALAYAAAMNVSLVYYKLLDDVADDKSIKSKVSSMILSSYKSKFNRNVTMINDIIEENLKKLSYLEVEKKFSSIDEIAHPFSEIVGKILNLYPEKFEGDSEEVRGNLYELGYSLGKWIYLIDALDDLKEDMEKNKFNPIDYLYNTDSKTYEELMEEIRDRMEFTIFNCGYTCRNALENLPIKRNKEILENIISLGMMDKYTKITTECECNKRSGKNESV